MSGRLHFFVSCQWGTFRPNNCRCLLSQMSRTLGVDGTLLESGGRTSKTPSPISLVLIGSFSAQVCIQAGSRWPRRPDKPSILPVPGCASRWQRCIGNGPLWERHIVQAPQATTTSSACRSSMTMAVSVSCECTAVPCGGGPSGSRSPECEGMLWRGPRRRRAGAADAAATTTARAGDAAIRSAVDATPTCRHGPHSHTPHSPNFHPLNADAPPPSGGAQPATGYRPMGGGNDWRQQGATGDVPGGSAPAQPASNFNDWAAPGR